MHQLYKIIRAKNFDRQSIDLQHKVGIFSGGGRWTLELTVCAIFFVNSTLSTKSACTLSMMNSKCL